MADRVSVMLESECSEADLAAVAEIFAEKGIPADVSAAYSRRSASDLPWLIVIGISFWISGTFVKAALEAAGDEAGRQGWRALKHLVQALYEARKGTRAPTGRVSIRITEPPVEIPLPPSLPDDAYRELWEIEKPSAPISGIIMWDNETQSWIDAQARRIRCDYPHCHELATQERVGQTSEGQVMQRSFCDEHAAASDAGDLGAWN